MQDQKMNDFILLSVPMKLFEEADIRKNDILQMYAEDGKLIIESTDDIDDFVCDGICEDCPCAQTCEESEEC